MAEEKTSILLSDVSIEGKLVEKDKIVIDAKINGDITAGEIITHPNSNIKGNIISKNTFIGGKFKGDINSDRVCIRKAADVEGSIKHKTLTIKEGSVFEASLLTFEDIKLPKTFTLRIGVGRDCLLLFEEKKEKPEEIWLNLYTIKKIFGKDVKLRESQMLRFVLSHYIIGTGFKVEDLEKIFSN